MIKECFLTRIQSVAALFVSKYHENGSTTVCLFGLVPIINHMGTEATGQSGVCGEEAT